MPVVLRLKKYKVRMLVCISYHIDSCSACSVSVLRYGIGFSTGSNGIHSQWFWMALYHCTGFTPINIGGSRAD